MKLSRPSRAFRLIAAFAALSILCMQFAMASYVCPGVTAGSAMSIAGSLEMAGCDGMDTAQPVLCHARMADQAGQQSPDKLKLPHVQAFVPVSLMQVLHASDIVSRPFIAQTESLILTRTTAPPISIRNCCFRI